MHQLLQAGRKSSQPGQHAALKALGVSAAAESCKQVVLQEEHNHDDGTASSSCVRGSSSATASTAIDNSKLDRRLAAVHFQHGSSEGTASRQRQMPGWAAAAADAARQGAPAEAPPAGSCERRRSSYILHFPSSNNTTAGNQAAATGPNMQQLQQTPGVTVVSAEAAADVYEQQQRAAAISPDAPDSPRPGQALLNAGWIYEEDHQQQQQQVYTTELAAVPLLLMQSVADSATERQHYCIQCHAGVTIIITQSRILDLKKYHSSCIAQCLPSQLCPARRCSFAHVTAPIFMTFRNEFMSQDAAVTTCAAVLCLQAGWRSRLGAATDAAMNSMAVAVLFDLADAALYFLDILTDVKVMQVRPAAASQPASWCAALVATSAVQGGSS